MSPRRKKGGKSPHSPTSNIDIGKYYTTMEAAQIAGVTTATIGNWCKRYGIGKKVGGLWRIHGALFEKFMNGE